MNKTYKTIGTWLTDLVHSTSSTEEDAHVMTKVLRQKLGFHKAIVVYGVVYLEGKGTVANPPRSIHAIAKSLQHYMQEG